MNDSAPLPTVPALQPEDPHIGAAEVDWRRRTLFWPYYQAVADGVADALDAVLVDQAVHQVVYFQRASGNSRRNP